VNVHCDEPLLPLESVLYSCMPLNTFECSVMDVLSFLIKGQMWQFNEVDRLVEDFFLPD